MIKARPVAGDTAAIVLPAPGFVGGVYALRHAVYALAGRSYRHEPWPEVLAYELPKFTLFCLLILALPGALLIGFALSRGQQKPRVAFLNQVPTAANKCTTSSEMREVISFHFPWRESAFSSRPRSSSPCADSTGQ